MNWFRRAVLPAALLLAPVVGAAPAQPLGTTAILRLPL